jgi:glutaredoxin
MIYLYSKPMCGACIAQKKKYDKEGTRYEERDAGRLSSPAEDFDEVDREARVLMAMQNETLPVIVDWEPELVPMEE